MNRIDEHLTGLNLFLSSLVGKITPNIILCIALINGFAFGLVTTGYLADQTVDALSPVSLLIVWQFIITSVLSSQRIKLNTKYLTRFFIAIVLGYYTQWQVFGSYVQNYDPEKVQYIKPVVEGASGNFIFFMFFVMGASHCFSDKDSKIESTMDTKI